MKAIVTKYVGQTDTKGSRIIAKANGVPAMTLAFNSDLTYERNHEDAARNLRDREGWSGRMVGGGLPDESGYCFTFDESRIEVPA